MNPEITKILEENKKRNEKIHSVFNPITGEGSIGERRQIFIKDIQPSEQWIPVGMAKNKLVSKLIRRRSVESFIKNELKKEVTQQLKDYITILYNRIRMSYDFPFWAATYVFIKNKDITGVPEIRFRLSYPQRKFVSVLEEMRLAEMPIRLVLLKARQWGGSTTSQLYMSWLQLTHKKGLNSLIIAHQGSASDEIKDMFDRMINSYPIQMLCDATEGYSENEAKMTSVGKSGSIFRIPRRDCKIKIGTAERPDSCRGGDYALVHLSEVGIWKETEGKKPTDIVRSACGGVMNKPGTMIVYESTANGHGNFFHTEYMDARDNPNSQFKALFVPWFDIDWNIIPFRNEAQELKFAKQLYENRNNSFEPTNREEAGKYLWKLWEMGATLEGINWYIAERAKHTSHGAMASECPSDDIEAFVNSGAAVFDKYLVDALRVSCRRPLCIGDVYADQDAGEDAVKNVRFKEDSQGVLQIWQHPDPVSEDEIITDRYLTVVDIGGRSHKADWSVIVVFDRISMIDGEPPAVVAQWRGHTDIDLLAWKATQIASYYHDALLVIESNTLETNDRTRVVDGDQSHFILNQIRDVYPNLYFRRQSEDDIREHKPKKYGFHTNTATKPMVISGLIKYVREQAWVEADSKCLDELLNYERKPNGSFGAIVGYHDDLLMTRAIGLHICFQEMALPRIIETNRKPIDIRSTIRTNKSLANF